MLMRESYLVIQIVLQKWFYVFNYNLQARKITNKDCCCCCCCWSKPESLTTFLSCSSLEDPSTPSSLPLSAVFSSSRNSHRHCTGSTSSDPSDDWTSSASHGILWDAPWKETKQNILTRIQWKLSQRTPSESQSSTFDHRHNTPFEPPSRQDV